MGCAGSASPPASSEANAAKEHVIAPAEATWATRTEAAADVGPAYSYGSSTLPGRHGEALRLDDADDDFDEIEIIQEATPTQKSQPRMWPPAANPQDAPQADSFAGNGMASPIPSKPLSKQQMEEAAKLAERRKRFDNQRYQREQRDEQPDSAAPYNPANQSTLRGAGSSSSVLRADMSFGLSLNEVGAIDLGLQDSFLPGGIIDDGDEKVHAKPLGKRSRNNHNEFDDDDERLMKEILENCSDM